MRETIFKWFRYVKRRDNDDIMKEIDEIRVEENFPDLYRFRPVKIDR